jgi:hypothetical protein
MLSNYRVSDRVKGETVKALLDRKEKNSLC